MTVFGFDKIDDNWKEYSKKDLVYSVDFDSMIVKLLEVDVAVVENFEELNTLEDAQFNFLNAKDIEAQYAILRANLGVFY